ncbi:MAG: CinA family protein [Xanthomonadales bacterium]|nr:CinA family protein [Xanthomonadales bacterium]
MGGHGSGTVAEETLRELAARVADRLLAARGVLAVAESCTGGLIAKTLTDIPGASAWFDCGVVAYSYEAKQALLGVRQETLLAHGAVSRETVLEMVAGALVRSGASHALAVTGIAGPGGGTAEKPVGTVWLAWKRRGDYPQARLERFGGDRESIRRESAAAALRGLLALLG